MVFSTVAIPIYIPTNSVQVFPFLQVLCFMFLIYFVSFYFMHYLASNCSFSCFCLLTFILAFLLADPLPLLYICPKFNLF